MSAPISTGIKAFSHYIEQPQVIDKLGKTAAWTLGLGAPAALWTMDTFKAPPEERKKAGIRNAIVLASVSIATLFAARKWMMFKVPGQKAKSFVERHWIEQTLANGATHMVDEDLLRLQKAAREIGPRYTPELRELMTKEHKSLGDFRKLITDMRTQAPNEEQFKQDIEKLLPLDEHHHGHGGHGGHDHHESAFWTDFKGHSKELVEFGKVGGIPVLAGLLGGLAANKINGHKGRTGDMVKESIFQFVSNIAFPVLIAGTGIAALSLPAISKRLKGVSGRVIRFGVVGGSLAFGIGAGMLAANKIGEKWIDPMLAKLQGQPAPAPKAKALDGLGMERKPDFWDIFLHIDDLPAAFAMAGIKILMPFIPFLFGLSGYRAGVGFRNGGEGGGHHHGPQNDPAASLSNASPLPNVAPAAGIQSGQPPAVTAAPPSLLQQNHVFNQFYQLQHSTAAAMTAPPVANPTSAAPAAVPVPV